MTTRTTSGRLGQVGASQYGMQPERMSPEPAGSGRADMRRSLLRSTLRALAAPRRLVPILVVAIPLVAAQAEFSRDPLAAPLGMVMCLVFFLLAPVSWRALFPPDGEGPAFGAPFGRVVVYAVAGAGTVLIVGSVIPSLLGIGLTMMTTDASLLVSIALFWVGGYGLGRDIDLERSLADARAHAHSMAQEAERSQLLALRSHLDPHFLFNTLNAIAEWCREDGAVAERATLELSQMLRTVLAASRLPSWPLSREVDLALTLLDLHLIRDPNRFDIDKQIAVDLPALEVPPMVLLPLVENAVKHGPAAGYSGALTLRVDVEGDELVVEIRNPGPFGGPRRGGEGLALVRKRLAHAYGGRARMSVHGKNNYTHARVSIPLGLRVPEVNA